MVKRIAGDVFGELLETGKTAVKQTKQISPRKIADTAVEQISGVNKIDTPPPGLEDLKGKKVSPAQLQRMRQNDAIKKSKGLGSTRLALKRLIIQRYQQIQQQILRKSEEKEQAGLEEEREELEELREKEEKEKKKPEVIKLPKGPKKKHRLGIFVRQKRGSKEIKLGKMG